MSAGLTRRQRRQEKRKPFPWVILWVLLILAGAGAWGLGTRGNEIPVVTLPPETPEEGEPPSPLPSAFSQAAVEREPVPSFRQGAYYADPAPKVAPGIYPVSGQRGPYFRLVLGEENESWVEGSHLTFSADPYEVRYEEYRPGLWRFTLTWGEDAGLLLERLPGGKTRFRVETPGWWPTWSQHQTSLTLLGIPHPDASWRFPLAAGEWEALSISSGGVEFSFQEPFFMSLTEVGAGFLEGVFSRRLEDWEETGGGFLIRLAGEVAVESQVKDKSLLLRFPGASASANALSKGAYLEKGGAALELPLPPPYAIRRDPAGILVTPAPSRWDQRVVVIDAGHGGKDEGAVSPIGDFREKDKNLEVALALGKKLTALGARVVYTRTTDEPLLGNARELEARVDLINGAHPDVVLSIHHDIAPSPKVRGVAVYYSPLNLNREASERLASLVEESLSRSLGFPRLVSQYGRAQRYYVITPLDAPAILIEMGFVSNPKDVEIMRDAAYEEKAADAIVRGLEAYFSSSSP
ncbi:MAG: N-acetylmuramoyl-L-alanine amidase [Bacillota bacterium]|nr:N-acetylmuramoyl-L-alanine amidase [Bacillota bacterium]